MPKQYERKPNTGAFFKNDRKTNDNQPDYTGRFKDESGKEWRLAGWIAKPQKGGDPYINLKISDPDDFKQKSESEQDDIPF